MKLIVGNLFFNPDTLFGTLSTYEVPGSTINGSVVFSLDGSDEILMELFRTDSSITLTYKEEVMRNGGVNDIEIDLFFLEAN